MCFCAGIVVFRRNRNFKGESYSVLKGRLANILPDMRRLYNGGEAGELMREGQSTGIFVKLVLSADKPFMRKINGLPVLSHNANCFGPPCCSCTDEDLYNFTFNKKKKGREGWGEKKGGHKGEKGVKRVSFFGGSEQVAARLR